MAITIDYTIVTGFSPKDLIELVKEKLKEGWKPIGGVSSLVGIPYTDTLGVHQQTVHQQAMIKEG